MVGVALGILLLVEIVWLVVNPQPPDAGPRKPRRSGGGAHSKRVVG